MTKIRLKPADRSTGKFSDMSEPTGFVNRTDSTLDLTADRFTINPAVTSFDYYVAGKKYTVSSSDVVNVNYIDLADTEGQHYIYYDGAVLSVAANPTDTEIDVIIRTKVLVCIIYYDATNNVGIYVGEERHGITMDGDTHAHIHFSLGLVYLDGLGLNTIDADQDGSLASHAQFGIDAGTIRDEDIRLTPTAIGSTDGMNIYYRDGATGAWRRTTQANFAVKVTGSGRLAWNELTGGAWQLTEVADNKFVLCHIFATTEKDNPMISVIGQSTYITQVAAREGATTEINSLLLGNLPTPEMRPIATVIFQTKDSYTNSINARIRTTDEGDDYVDWRTTGVTRGTPIGDHDHLEYIRHDGTRDFTGTQKTQSLLPIVNSIYNIGSSILKYLNVWCDGIYFAANRYFIWDVTKNQLTMRAPEKINYQISDTVVFNITYTSADVNSGLPLKWKIGGRYCGFQPVAVPGNNIWKLPAADAAGFWKSDGADNLSIANPTYADVKRTSCVVYMDLLVSDVQGIVAIRQWQDETITADGQPDVPRNMTVTAIMGIGVSIDGTVTVHGIDADGAVISEVFTISHVGIAIYTGNRAFAKVTSIVTDQTGTSVGSFYHVGFGEKLGLPNYPFNATSDVFKMKIGTADQVIALWAINITYGTVASPIAVSDGNDYTFWYRPYK